MQQEQEPEPWFTQEEVLLGAEEAALESRCFVGGIATAGIGTASFAARTVAAAGAEEVAGTAATDLSFSAACAGAAAGVTPLRRPCFARAAVGEVTVLDAADGVAEEGWLAAFDS